MSILRHEKFFKERLEGVVEKRQKILKVFSDGELYHSVGFAFPWHLTCKDAYASKS